MALPDETAQQTQAVITRALQLTQETRELLRRAQQWSWNFQQTLAQVIPRRQRPASPAELPWRPQGIVVIEPRTAKARAYLLMTRM